MSTTFNNEVSLVIDNQVYHYWSRISISRSIDGIDTAELEGPFDPTVKLNRQTFKPLSYKPISIRINGSLVFTGVMSPVVFRLTPEKTEFAVGAYALPGKMAELMVPGSESITEFKHQNLHEMASTLADFFDIKVTARVGPGPVFKKAKIEPDQTVLSFLVELAKQRNQVISNTEIGDLLFWNAITSGPAVAVLEQGLPPLLGVVPAINPAEYFSEITGIKPVKVRSKSSVKFTVLNPFLRGVFRPYTFVADDTQDGDLKAAVTAKMSRMYANAIAYTLEVASWCDANGNVWKPNMVIRLYAPGVAIYRPFDFIIRSVTLDKDANTEKASLDVMMPGSFASGQIGRLPWDD